ncbi:hypothetical protein [Streptomyces cylindrosporus]|uniref:Uncharacterized protein n=1 Tax=Streptomyces cylindrosporus TaxID=2927583 RepID=A0ABS9Y1F8_9ACTN|nr:hypothetical protein [Streptomyces cylindrosporus]MCI3271056.1 hypothetical protein [Streptomyces cylindrosporus]
MNELPRVLRSYSFTVATMLRPADVGERFNVTVFGSSSGRVYGRDQWAWDAIAGRYQPHGTPWVPRTEAVNEDLAHLSSVIPFGRKAVPADAPPMAA